MPVTRARKAAHELTVARPKATRAHPTEARPEALLAAAKADPTDRVLAIAARCIQCASYWVRTTAEAPKKIRDCPATFCALHRLRPYRIDGPPRGREQKAYRGIAGFGEVGE